MTVKYSKHFARLARTAYADGLKIKACEHVWSSELREVEGPFGATWWLASCCLCPLKKAFCSLETAANWIK